MEGKQSQTPASYRDTSQDKRSLLILHINENTDDQVLFQAAAKHAEVPVEWHVVESAQRGVSYLESLINLSREHEPRWVDLVLLELVLPDDNGLAVLKHVRGTPELRHLPVVILTGHENPSTHKEAYELGANAVHLKPAKFEDSVQLVRMLYTHWNSAVLPTRQK